MLKLRYSESLDPSDSYPVLFSSSCHSRSRRRIPSSTPVARRWSESRKTTSGLMESSWPSKIWLMTTTDRILFALSAGRGFNMVLLLGASNQHRRIHSTMCYTQVNWWNPIQHACTLAHLCNECVGMEATQAPFPISKSGPASKPS